MDRVTWTRPLSALGLHFLIGPVTNLVGRSLSRLLSQPESTQVKVGGETLSELSHWASSPSLREPGDPVGSGSRASCLRAVCQSGLDGIQTAFLSFLPPAQETE